MGINIAKTESPTERRTRVRRVPKYNAALVKVPLFVSYETTSRIAHFAGRADEDAVLFWASAPGPVSPDEPGRAPPP